MTATTNDLFADASRRKLRYATTRGSFSVEDLWDLPLQSATKVNLDDIARSLQRRLQGADLDNIPSFVDDTPGAPDPEIKLMFDIAKHIIDVRKAERKAENEARAKSDQKQKLLAALADRDDADLKTKPREELIAMINAL